MKRIAILGCTGSVGRNTLEVVASHPEQLRVVAMAARSRIDLLAQQVAVVRPSLVAVWDEPRARELERLGCTTRIAVGPQGLVEAATHPDVDIVVVATAGPDALVPVIRAIQAGKRIALASKELLVMAGSLLVRLVQEHGIVLVPIDSEHAALFQCLQGVRREDVARLVITGSGGPLWGLSPSEMAGVSREQVQAHPRWKMGPKITVDSATLMNKGLEVIEAQWLFEVPLERIRVVIHPEAVVHGFVELRDGSLLAQLSPCDMRLPIQYALSFPERWPAPAARLELTRLAGLHFEEPDLQRFPCLGLALDAARQGGTACVALNGANDEAVASYLEGELAFADIPRLIAETLEQHAPLPHPTLDEILAVDAWARRTARERIHEGSPS